jgi:hypothetical protein
MVSKSIILSVLSLLTSLEIYILRKDLYNIIERFIFIEIHKKIYI